MERFAATANSSPTFTSLPSKPSLRDVSFSSYLRPEEHHKSFQGRVSHQIAADDTEISIFDAKKYFNENPDQKTLQKPPNLDKIVERCDYTTIHRLSSVSSVDGYGRNYRTGSFNATPTASSEASWNSQTGLLSKPPGSIAVSMKNLPLNDQRKSSSTTKSLFRRKCPCSGKKSVNVEERFSQPINPVPSNLTSHIGCSNHKPQSVRTDEAVHEKANKERTEKSGGFEVEEISKMKVVARNSSTVICNSATFPPESSFPAEIGRRVVPSGRSFSDAGGFSFPILNPPASGSSVEDPPRESLEVFRPPLTVEETTIRKSAEFQRRMLAPFPGDVARRSFTFPASPKARTPDDDIASDSSSDLFEIESFSNNATSTFAMFRRRESLDEITRYVGSGTGLLNFRRSLDETTTTTTSVAPTEIYEPSEVSVDWSVTTAEGFDRNSVANFSASVSEFGETRTLEEEVGRSMGGSGGKKRGTGLMSCQCEKAVSVGPHPVKCGFEQQIRIGPPRYPVESGRIAAMARLGNGGSVHMPRAPEKSSLARSNSARLTRTYISR
ncbi:protein PHYTOCHROME KINASE SUBSTRATE 4-like [Aristolochia californica]|uniref:protein PHYTOCHROME KINASE SUBSTRATE 4-like n=1 Tax=Aristolochia californica TaxID=171875 RepID=UPI0035E226A0